MGSSESPLRRSYDRIAAHYADRFADELAHKPFDRHFLDRLAADISVRGWTIDLGSGPSQIGAYLALGGLRVLSVDLSRAMLHEARALRPDAVCLQADMRALPWASQSIAAIVAFYSLIHIPQADLAGTLREIRRVLSPGGRFALTVHIGTETVHRDEMLGEAVDIDFFFFDPDRQARELEEAGFVIQHREERDPYPGGVEAETRRAYIVAGPE